jgi:Rrf2 family protein
MRLKRQTELAIAILIACERAGGQRVRVADAARFAGSTSSFTAQIAHTLVQAGFLQARRGRRGGFALAKEARDTRLGELIGQLQPETAAKSGTDGIPYSDTVGELSRIMGGADHAVQAYLNRYSIADLARIDSGGSSPIHEAVGVSYPETSTGLLFQAKPARNDSRLAQDKS